MRRISPHFVMSAIRCALVFFPGALLAFFLFPRPLITDLLSRLAPDGRVEFVTDRFLGIARIAAGIGLLAGLGLSRFLDRSSFERKVEATLVDFRALLASLRREFGSLARLPPVERWTLALVILVGAGLRLSLQDLPMRHDEAKTFFAFVSRPLLDGISNYYVPNNHVFHTFLAHFSTALFGDAPWAIRLPSLLAGIATIPLTYWLGRRLLGRRSALLGAALVAVCPPLVDASSDARGYTLVAACALLAMATLAHRTDKPAAWCLGGPIFALAFWAVPVAMISFLAFLLWQAQARKTRLRHLVGGFLWVGALSGLPYLPAMIRSGPMALIANENVRPIGLIRTLEGMPAFVDSFLSWTAGGSRWVVVMALALVVVAAWPARRRTSSGGRLAKALVGALIGLAILQQVLPPLRVWGPTLPLVCLLIARGGARLLACFNRGRRLRLMPGLATVAALVAALLLSTTAWNDSWLECPEAERFAARIMASAGPEDLVITATPVAGPLRYYLMRRGFDPQRLVWVFQSEKGRDALDSGKAAFLVIREETFGLGQLGLVEASGLELLDRGPTSKLYRRP